MVMKEVEKGLSQFESHNKFYRHMLNDTLDEFHAEFEKAAEHVRKNVLGQDIPMMINGEPVEADAGWAEVHSPADTRMLVCRYPKSTKQDAVKSIKAAKAGWEKWRTMPHDKRADIIDKAADKFEENFYELCAIETMELCKNRYEASIDVDEAIDFLRFYAMSMREWKGFRQNMSQAFPDEYPQSVLKPYGVFSVICPFNFPVAITSGMTAGALVTGNAAIMKPSLKGVLAGYRSYQLFIEGGVPPGALQFMVGPDEEIAVELTSNDDVNGVVFTGSKPVAMKVIQQMQKNDPSKPVIAEMGGKNPIIVTKNADLDKAVEGSYRAAFGAQGQKCSAASRLLVDKEIKDEFLRRLVERTRDTVIGPTWKKETMLGPIVEEKKHKEYQKIVERIKKDGGEILTGGGVPKNGDLQHGYYVEPTIATGLSRDHDYFHNELFMPVTICWEVDGLDDALEAANAVEYGLTAGIFTEDKDEAEMFFDQIQAGTVYHNRRRGGCTASMVNVQAFTGWKHSGSTGIGAGGRWYLQQFMREQSQTRVVEE